MDFTVFRYLIVSLIEGIHTLKSGSRMAGIFWSGQKLPAEYSFYTAIGVRRRSHKEFDMPDLKKIYIHV